jgi:hypothetical protein
MMRQASKGKEWIDRGRYWENVENQGTEKWKEVRIGRNTSSTTGALAGKSSFKTPEEIGQIIAGVKVEEFAPKNIEYMAWGTKYEPFVRDYFAKQNNLQILERGLCVLKSDITLGASVDGDIIGTDGCIEIKCPQKMYRGLQSYIDNVAHGWIPPQGYLEHIFPTHVTQCMQACFVLGKKYCVYIVYCVDTQQMFTQKVNFCQKYWDEHYAVVKKNYALYVAPHLKNSKYPLIPY